MSILDSQKFSNRKKKCTHWRRGSGRKDDLETSMTCTLFHSDNNNQKYIVQVPIKTRQNPGLKYIYKIFLQNFHAKQGFFLRYIKEGMMCFESCILSLSPLPKIFSNLFRGSWEKFFF